MTPQIKLKRLPHGEGLSLPAFATDGAAGFDICSADSFSLLIGRRKLVRTGFAVELEPGWELQVRPRSGLAMKHGITVLNAPGTIDADYRGEIGVMLANHGFSVHQFERGDRIAQLVLQPVWRPTIIEVDDLTDTARGSGGFGSTG